MDACATDFFIRAINKQNASTLGYEGTDGGFMLYKGGTRATRIAKLAPGLVIQVEVIGKLPRAFASEPRIGDLLP